MDISYLSQCVTYYPTTGQFYWRERPLGHFATERAGRAWNTRNANQPVCLKDNGKGYLRFVIGGFQIYAHRAAFALVHGDWPTLSVDHRNHNKYDNRAKNLRQVTNAQNAKNKTLHSHNTSGIPGLGWHKASGKWRVQLGKVHVGTFDCIGKAVAARKESLVNLRYSAIHGRTKPISFN